MNQPCPINPDWKSRIRCVLFVSWYLAVAGGASTSHAHGMQYLLAKVSPSPGKLRLEITADFGGNPLIESEAAARVAIGGILAANFAGENGREDPLGKSAAFEFHATAAVDPTCPMQLPAMPADSAAHQFLTGVVELSTNSKSVTFSVPKGNPNDAILWVVDEVGQPIADQKFYLVSGEHTGSIAVPTSSRSVWFLALGVGVAGTIGIWFRKKFAGRDSSAEG